MRLSTDHRAEELNRYEDVAVDALTKSSLQYLSFTPRALRLLVVVVVVVFTYSRNRHVMHTVLLYGLIELSKV